MNCYHIKEWLINSGSINNVKVTEFINKHQELKICKDLCNGVKHLKLDHRPSIGDKERVNIHLGEGVTLHREYDPYHTAPNVKNPIENSKYVIIANWERYDVFELAETCVKLWEKFCKDNSLL